MHLYQAAGGDEYTTAKTWLGACGDGCKRG